MTILLYHGVTDTLSNGIENFSRKHIDARDFDIQMKYIKNNCTVLSMDDVVTISRTGASYPPNAVAVTFDDGFRNNYTVAAPILEKYKIPATFYITSGIINTDIMFWVDKLEDCINLTQKKYINISLDKDYCFELISEEQKIDALLTIKSYCKKVDALRKDEIVSIVIEQSQITPSVHHAKNYEKMSWKELKKMDENDLFIIGGHSLYHNILSQIKPFEQLQLDIQTSIGLLQYNLGRPMLHYSYPEGQAIHYNEEVIECLKKEGIVCCPSAIDGVNEDSIDLFNLKRIMVGFMGTPFPF